MAEARERAAWSHTSAIMALIANVNRDPKKTRPYKPDDFNPLARRRDGDAVEINKDTISLLKQSFVRGGI